MSIFNNKVKVFILVGGYGTRLRSVVKDVPKPMAMIHGKPFLDYQINEIEKSLNNVEIYLLSYYKAEIISKYYADHSNINIIVEKEALGTGGSIKNAIKELNLSKDESILILNGDTYLEVDFKKFILESSKEINILASFQEDCSRYGTLEIKDNCVISFKEKQKTTNSYINAGCYFLKKLSFLIDNKTEKFALEDAFIEYLNLNNNIGSFKYNGIFIDIGIPEDYYLMQEYIKVKNLGK
ncbi:D-glycero-D-manno-heptose 1-phosphate guanosyltransferase [Arcobacter sp. CECT 8983]|uniref:sugar phosphate nucleotidyltransferase n=1 Tax=Arcobacter sp. CECT 8983 TaxID=2044508 RepID=UPI00100C16BC|nr:sugar phosphate nucleotidyltransferase [Arcobacter sp. CECT 8983]RXJ89460.1 D-glycero-D-manno-heptose 1-phosphate guanosyltransferase [Arcobacter sp. CECT 8983]